MAGEAPERQKPWSSVCASGLVADGQEFVGEVPLYGRSVRQETAAGENSYRSRRFIECSCPKPLARESGRVVRFLAQTG